MWELINSNIVTGSKIFERTTGRQVIREGQIKIIKI